MNDLDRVKKLAGILNEDYQYDMSDKGDMHDALGDVQLSIDGAMKGLQKANELAGQVHDEIEKTLYTDESVEQVKELNSKNIMATMPFMKAVKQYLENQDGQIVGDYDVDEPRLYIDVGAMIDDVMKMLEAEYPDVEIIKINQSPNTYYKD
tara:strand:+ start:277 stop:729 length:453 start_codon:yes stop_codon:yes gene_type:complete